MICLNCRTKNLSKIVKLGKQPLSGFFYNQKKHKLKKYSLDLYKCSECDLVQLDNKVKTEIMYGKHYGYQTSISQLMISHLEKKVEKLKKKFLKPKDNILDIGSNDATFLRLLGKKYNLWGIDPSAKKFKKNYEGMKLVTNFFSKENIIKKNRNKDIQFKLISSFAIFYDIENPSAFCDDIESLLDDNGIWICEFSYLPLMLKNLTFDQICHEHLTYYTLSVFEKIIEKSNLKIINYKLNEINGGSIEIIVSKNSSKIKRKIELINKIKNDEKKINLNSYKNFEKRINASKTKLKAFVKNHYPIAGYGASTKGNVVLNFYKLSSNHVTYICDSNKKKYGKFTPGANIKIVSKEKMRELNPKYLLVLIWSFRSEIVRQELNYLKNGGNLVFHLPKFHIINKKNYRKYLNKSFKELSYNY